MVGFWQSDQKASDRQAATVAAELHTNTSLNIGEVNQVSPDVFTRLVAALDGIEALLRAPRTPVPFVSSLGFAAGGAVRRQINLPPYAAWALSTIALMQRPGATGTYNVTVSGIFYDDFTILSDTSGIQAKELGVPVQQAMMVALTETGAATTGGATLYLVFAPL